MRLPPDAMQETAGKPGWIRLHRRITEHSLWPAGRKFTKLEAWLDLLLMANFKDSKVMTGGRIIHVRRGQVFTSQVSLAKRWRWDRSSVIAFLKLLKLDSQINIETSTKTNSGFTIITICNYEKYQALDEPETNSQTHSENNSRSTATQQPSNTSEECKEGKEEIPLAAKAVISRLNELAATSYRSTTKATVRHIRARLAEGFTETDLLAVVEDRCRRWKGDSKMSEYLRPSTLFAGKFEEYLQAVRANGKPAEGAFLG